MATTRITVVDRGLAAYLVTHGMPVKSFSRKDNRTEFVFAMGRKKFERMSREYFDSPLQKFDQAKISLMKLTADMRMETAKAKPKGIASRPKRVRPKDKMDESQVIPGRPKRMINL
jgi:hypothetical protein